MLSSDQQFTLDEFHRISGSSLTTEEETTMLENNNWHLERALLDYNERYPEEASSHLAQEVRSTELHRGGSWSMPGAFPGSGTGVQAAAEPSKLHQYVQKTGKMVLDGVMYLLVVPFYVVYRIIGAILTVLVGYLSPVIRKFPINRGYQVVKKRNDPADVSRRFAMEFDEIVGGAGSSGAVRLPDEESQGSGLQRPDFLECAYTEALYMVKKEAQWLMIYVQSGAHETTQRFAEDVVANPRFLEFVNERNMLCWGGDVKNSEAYQVANQFKVNRLPFIGLMCLTVSQTPTASGVQNSAPVVSLVCKVQGYNSCDEVLARMTRAYNKFNPTVATLRAEYERTAQARAMRDMQDQAYQKSLQRDREKKLAKQAEQELRHNSKKWRAWRRAQLRPEENSTGEYARVAIRFPDGHRTQFKFNKHCKIEELYAYIECECLHSNEEAPSAPSKPDNFTYKYPFKVVSVMPRSEVEPDETTQFKQSSLLYPSGNLVVEMS